MRKRAFCKYHFFLVVFFLISFFAKAQTSDLPKPGFRNNLIKLSLMPALQSINGNNQKWIGIDYERLLNNKMSVTALLDVGLFEDYTYTKYYDFFDEGEGFHYLQQTTKTKGYNFIPSFKYYFLTTKTKKGQGFYAAGNLDMNQYFSQTELYNSKTNSNNYSNSSTTRMAIGLTLGGQYVAFSRLVIDLNISLFTKLFSINNGAEASEIPPLNATWTFNNNNSWSTVNFMLGYAFGGGKKK